MDFEKRHHHKKTLDSIRVDHNCNQTSKYVILASISLHPRFAKPVVVNILLYSDTKSALPPIILFRFAE